MRIFRFFVFALLLTHFYHAKNQILNFRMNFMSILSCAFFISLFPHETPATKSPIPFLFVYTALQTRILPSTHSRPLIPSIKKAPRESVSYGTSRSAIRFMNRIDHDPIFLFFFTPSIISAKRRCHRSCKSCHRLPYCRSP